MLGKLVLGCLFLGLICIILINVQDKVYCDFCEGKEGLHYAGDGVTLNCTDTNQRCNISTIAIMTTNTCTGLERVYCDEEELHLCFSGCLEKENPRFVEACYFLQNEVVLNRTLSDMNKMVYGYCISEGVVR